MTKVNHSRGVNRSILMLFALQILILVLMGLFTTYGPAADAKRVTNLSGKYSDNATEEEDPMRIYSNVHVMIWIGFGFLMTFLRKYGQSAVGLTFLIGAVLVQVALLCDGVLNIGSNGKAGLSLEGLLSADVAVAAPLISMGALLGKTTYMQLISMGVIELILYTLNKYIGEHYFMAVDAGDSMYVHVFGAYFGLAASLAFGLKHKPKEHHLEGATYQSDIFAMIGTVFLWLFWPSFNSASLHGDDQQRAIINTLLSLTASCVIAFATSALVTKNNKFNMVHVQNSTLAGGVAIGTAAGMMCQPIGALVIGCLAGLISVLGYKYLTPLMQKYLRIHDTCGVHNLHGMPGVLAGLFGALMAGLADEENYNDSLYEIFPARAPKSGNRLAELTDNVGITAGLDRSAQAQAGYQLLTLVVTLVMALVSGLITGFIMRIEACGSVSEEHRFDDSVHWEIEDESVHEMSKNHGGSSSVVDQMPMAHL
ncbi:ammonium transporter Rh type A isoform X2 [Venturia canescens]|uniref:ammonium transporter Rh type A isoform X2 n=1 Tax=Venturia canescens TaxID=32260 RepID=UPI001C9D336A|nr:ammonium transporter Rh type A isoform X2 [Venturia canescens]